jgi:hypothetical protein
MNENHTILEKGHTYFKQFFYLPKLQTTNNLSPPTKFQLTKQCKGKDHNTNHVKKENNTMNINNNMMNTQTQGTLTT